MIPPPPSSFECHSVESDASLKAFLDALQFEDWNELDLPVRLLEPYGLLCIPYLEWWFEGEDISALFRLVVGEGSRSGWAVPLYQPVKPETECLKYPLDGDAAKWLAHEHIPYEPTLLIDDQFRLALLTWHTDEAYLCLRPHLFADYLAKDSVNFDLNGNGPIVDNFGVALREAFRRLDDWRALQDGWSVKHGGTPLPPLPDAFDRLRFQQSGIPE